MSLAAKKQAPRDRRRLAVTATDLQNFGVVNLRAAR